MSTFLTAEEVAERLRVTADTVRHYLRRKELIGVNRGGRTGWRIALEDYNRFVERRAADTDTPPPGCRVITISNQKGGVGKTTTTANVGYALAERGRRVLLVDVDPQANLTLGLGAAAAAEDRNIVNIFRHEDRGLSSSIVETKTPNLHLVPSHIDLANAEQLVAGRFGRERILHDAISSELRDHFDYILLDSPPNFGLLSDNCMIAADEVIVPVAAQYYAVQGMSTLLERIKVVKKKMNSRLEVLGLLATFYNPRTLLSREVVGRLPTYGQRVFKTIITEAVKVAESPAWSQTVIEFRPNSPSAEQYRSLASEIERELVSPTDLTLEEQT